MIAAGRGGGARLVVLTEMFSTGFSMARRPHRRAGGRSEHAVPRASRRARHGVWVCGSIPEHARACPAPVNRLVLAGPGRCAPPLRQDPPVHLQPASTSTTPRATRSSPSTSKACASASSSATTCASPTSSGRWRRRPTATSWSRTGPSPAASTGARCCTARAIENQAYVVGVNRVGERRASSTYAGDSTIIDPLGETLVRAARTETVISADGRRAARSRRSGPSSRSSKTAAEPVDAADAASRRYVPETVTVVGGPACPRFCNTISCAPASTGPSTTNCRPQPDLPTGCRCPRGPGPRR